MIVGDATTLGDDQDIKTEMETRGHTVTVVEDVDATASTGAGNDVVLVTGSISTANFDTELKDSSVPQVIMERNIWDTNNYCNDQFLDGGETLWDVSDDTHPITSKWGYTGSNLPCYTSSGGYGYTSGTASGGNAIMNTEGTNNFSTLIAFESGATLQNSDSTESRRVLFGAGATISDVPNFETQTWNLLESSLLWAAGKI